MAITNPHVGRNQLELEAFKEAAAKLEVMMSTLGESEDDIAADFKRRRLADKQSDKQ